MWDEVSLIYKREAWTFSGSLGFPEVSPVSFPGTTLSEMCWLEKQRPGHRPRTILQ